MTDADYQSHFPAPGDFSLLWESGASAVITVLGDSAPLATDNLYHYLSHMDLSEVFPGDYELEGEEKERFFSGSERKNVRLGSCCWLCLLPNRGWKWIFKRTYKTDTQREQQTLCGDQLLIAVIIETLCILSSPWSRAQPLSFQPPPFCCSSCRLGLISGAQEYPDTKIFPVSIPQFKGRAP